MPHWVSQVMAEPWFQLHPRLGARSSQGHRATVQDPHRQALGPIQWCGLYRWPKWKAESSRSIQQSPLSVGSSYRAAVRGHRQRAASAWAQVCALRHGRSTREGVQTQSPLRDTHRPVRTSPGRQSPLLHQDSETAFRSLTWVGCPAWPASQLASQQGEPLLSMILSSGTMVQGCPGRNHSPGLELTSGLAVRCQVCSHPAFLQQPRVDLLWALVGW